MNQSIYSQAGPPTKKRKNERFQERIAQTPTEERSNRRRVRTDEVGRSIAFKLFVSLSRVGLFDARRSGEEVAGVDWELDAAELERECVEGGTGVECLRWLGHGGWTEGG